jgi:DNA-binding XRE family transcriptional regulator
MREEPKRKDEAVQRVEETNEFWSKVTEIFFDNPALSLTLLYLYATVIGMFYSGVLYGSFGIRFLTQNALAGKADISQKQLSKIENDDVEPRFSTILKLADALGIEPERFLEEGA